MFRPMRRFKQQISRKECVRILREEKRGVLSMTGGNGYPYGVPMSHVYQNGRLYFHSAPAGHKVDAVRACEKASFCVIASDEVTSEKLTTLYTSVIVFGRIAIVEDMERIVDITTRLSLKFTQDEAYIREEIEKYARATLLLELTPEHICGKVVEES